MNILIIGYGKMGKTIEDIARERGHHIMGTIDVGNLEALKEVRSSEVDVAIEFSQPDAAFQNIKLCLESGIRVLSGTTGWLDRMEEIKTICMKNAGTFFYASNFSIGVNLFFRLNRYLAELTSGYPNYKPEITEIHHTEKKDAPSGTAITLAEDIMKRRPDIESWENNLSNKANVLGIVSKREGQVPGTHVIKYTSDIDRIDITHQAFSRKGFAQGAVLVSEWLVNQNGILNMDDFLKI